MEGRNDRVLGVHQDLPLGFGFPLPAVEAVGSDVAQAQTSAEVETPDESAVGLVEGDERDVLEDGQLPRRREGDPAGRLEIAGALALPAESAEASTVGRELQDFLFPLIEDIEIALAVLADRDDGAEEELRPPDLEGGSELDREGRLGAASGAIRGGRAETPQRQAEGEDPDHGSILTENEPVGTGGNGRSGIGRATGIRTPV